MSGAEFGDKFDVWVAELQRSDPFWVSQLSWQSAVRRFMVRRSAGWAALLVCGYVFIVLCAQADGAVPSWWGFVGFVAALWGFAGMLRVFLRSPRL